MWLKQQYAKAIGRGEIHDDPLQRNVLESLQKVTNALENEKLQWLTPWKKNSITGVYLFGPVGAGKTFLMDLFYQNVNVRGKMRVHFHQFMQQIDAQLRQLQGHPNPVKFIAEKLAKTTRLLCIDEFLVQDVATAMVLAELIHVMFECGMVLVMTSNTAPDDLYQGGLQRVRFLPAIALIKRHCEIIDLTQPRDYRLGRSVFAEAYLCPLNEKTSILMNEQFQALDTGAINETPLMVQGRHIPTIKRREHAVWFAFDVICNLPRSQLDYLEIASRFTTVFVSDIPILSPSDTVRAILLTHFIDVMYDRRIRLRLSAAAPIERLYLEGEVLTAFQRTQSRLQEMQSLDYPN